MLRRSPASRRFHVAAAPAFTIPEVLTVCAIVSVVLSIMLPMIGQAREHGRQAVCMSNLRQAGIGFRSYATEFKQYIPGPNTSGYSFRGVSPTNVATAPTEPITFDDWMSPTLGRAITLPRKKIDRLLAILNSEFHCPSNDYKYDYIYGPGIPGVQADKTFYNSYSAPFPMHYYWDAAHAAANGQPSGAVFGNNFDRGADIRPANHKFRTWSLGSPSGKVAATEGSRYLDDDGRVSFNTDAGSAFGGNFMNRSPTLNVFYQASGNPYKFAASGPPKLHPDSAKYAYRHVNDTLNAVFFDGHVVNLDNLASRKVSYWFPSKSKVVDTSVIGDLTVTNGHVIE
jgi:prepilin-type processing-associated H-X9-DG protein